MIEITSEEQKALDNLCSMEGSEIQVLANLVKRLIKENVILIRGGDDLRSLMEEQCTMESLPSKDLVPSLT